MGLVLIIMLIAMLAYLSRVVQGPSIWDRLHGLSLISTKGLFIVVLYASQTETAYLLDFAIIYTLLGYVSIIFISSFLLDKVKRGLVVNDNRRRHNNIHRGRVHTYWRNRLSAVQKLLHKDSGDGED